MSGINKKNNWQKIVSDSNKMSRNEIQDYFEKTKKINFRLLITSLMTFIILYSGWSYLFWVERKLSPIYFE